MSENDEGNVMPYIHGGDIYRNRVSMDFSVNVNPLGIPQTVKRAVQEAIEDCGRYPDITAEKLLLAVGKMHGVPTEHLLLGNGASEILMAVVHGLLPSKTVIPVPSFYGYEYAAGAANGEIVYYSVKEEDNFCLSKDLYAVLTTDVKLLFLANPGNPTGNLIGKAALKRILSHCQAQGIYVVIDECFIEFCSGDNSVISEIDNFSNLILVRAFTKIFSIPGIRLGYLVCSNQEILRKISRHLPEWNLSCFAHAAGCACALETDYARRTAAFIRAERHLLAEGLAQSGCKVYPSEANFVLCYSQEPLYERLLERGILIRDCRNFRGLCEGFYRIAVKGREENEKLLRVLQEIKS